MVAKTVNETNEGRSFCCILSLDNDSLSKTEIGEVIVRNP
jgi:hypothetical protein